MGMKKSIGTYAAFMAIAMGDMEGLEIVERNEDKSSKDSYRLKTKEPIPFNKQEGVLKMIEDYNLIRTGKSKKGILKQVRIKNKVDEWLKSGMLKEEDL